MLELRNVSFIAKNEDNGSEKEILHDVNLTINERFVALTGPNGGGKSTLAKIIFFCSVPILIPINCSVSALTISSAISPTIPISTISSRYRTS